MAGGTNDPTLPQAQNCKLLKELAAIRMQPQGRDIVIIPLIPMLRSLLIYRHLRKQKQLQLFTFKS
jgi:hypothetical protein